MVNCQDELSMHLLQEEAQAPGGSLSRIMLLPIPAEPNRRPWSWPGGIACLVGQFGSGWCPRLPVVLELCFSPAVRAAHKYGSQETPEWGGRVLLSHHSYIIWRTACLWVCTHTSFAVSRRDDHQGLWMHLFPCILKNRINGEDVWWGTKVIRRVYSRVSFKNVSYWYC